MTRSAEVSTVQNPPREVLRKIIIRIAQHAKHPLREGKAQTIVEIGPQVVNVGSYAHLRDPPRDDLVAAWQAQSST